MSILLSPGIPYVSKKALEQLAGLMTCQKPHVTPDGRVILAIHAGGIPPVATVNGQPVPIDDNDDDEVPSDVDPDKPRPFPWVFHVLDEHGLNMEHIVPGPGDRGAALKTVKFPIDAFDDVEKLVEYDHLPEARKDYTVYPRGHKLA